MTHITLRGKILYTSKKAERMDKERGREFFSLTEQADGTSVLHAHCEIDDAPLSRYFPMNAKPGKRAMTNVMMSSPDHRGATGPLLFPMKFSVVYEKDETITVGAGTFSSRKFLITDTAGSLPEEHPPYEIWVTRDKRGLFLQGGVGGYMMTWYELVELQT